MEPTHNLVMGPAALARQEHQIRLEELNAATKACRKTSASMSESLIRSTFDSKQTWLNKRFSRDTVRSHVARNKFIHESAAEIGKRLVHNAKAAHGNLKLNAVIRGVSALDLLDKLPSNAPKRIQTEVAEVLFARLQVAPKTPEWISTYKGPVDHLQSD